MRPIARKLVYASVHQRLTRKYGDPTPGIASNYLQRLADIVRPGLKIVLYCRVSGRVQDHRGNLADQLAGLRRPVEELGGVVVEVHCEVTSGYVLDSACDRYRLECAAAAARRYDTVLVAHSTDRFVRHIFYSKKNQAAWPTVTEFEKLCELTRGVPLVTILQPDMPYREVRGQQTRRGLRRRPRPGYKKRRRDELLGLVRQLRDEWKLSLREIEYETDVPLTTVKRWLAGET